MPEILFQPSIIGHEQAGISETVDYILKLFPEDIQQRLVENVFVTGSLAGLPGLKDRLETDLLASRPFQVWPLTHFFLFTFCEKSLI